MRRKDFRKCTKSKPIQTQKYPCDNLTRGARGHVLTFTASLATSEVNVLPGPVTAAIVTTQDVHLDSVALDGASDTIDSHILDSDTVRWVTGRGTILVVLLDNNTVVGDAGESDVGESDVGDGTSGIVNSLDTDTVLGVADSGRGEGDVLDSVVATATNGSNGQTVSTGAGTTREVDVLTRVNGNTVVLVLDHGAGDGDVSGLADIEAVGVVTAVVVTVGVVDGDILDGQVVGLDAEHLNGGVLDGETRDGRLIQRVGIEELRLGLAAVGTFAVPPARTVSVNDGVVLGSDGDFLSGDLDQGTIPLLVAEGGGA